MVLALSATLPLAWACGRAERVASEQLGESDVAPVASEQEKAGTGQPGDLNPIEAESFVDDVTLGSEVGADGAIVAGKTGDDFTAGQTVHLAMEVGDTPAGSAVKVVWYGPGDARLGEDSQSVTAGTRYLTFSARDTASWALGDYRAEVWIGDEKVASEHFNIVEPGDQAL
jgi:hypothetical protein